MLIYGCASFPGVSTPFSGNFRLALTRENLQSQCPYSIIFPEFGDPLLQITQLHLLQLALGRAPVLGKLFGRLICTYLRAWRAPVHVSRMVEWKKREQALQAAYRIGKGSSQQTSADLLMAGFPCKDASTDTDHFGRTLILIATARLDLFCSFALFSLFHFPVQPTNS